MQSVETSNAGIPYASIVASAGPKSQGKAWIPSNMVIQLGKTFMEMTAKFRFLDHKIIFF